MQEYFTSLDSIFLFGTAVIGFFAVYKSVRHYFLIKSPEYLIIAIILFGQAYFAFFRFLLVCDLELTAGT